MKLPNQTNEAVYNYMLPSTHRSASLDMMVLALYMQTSEMLCWNRVKVKNVYNKLEFPMLYAFNFSKSGSYKDEVINVVKETIKDSLSIKRYEVKKTALEEMLTNYKMETAELKGEEKKAVPKPRSFKDIYKNGTIQGLQGDRIASGKLGIGHVHYSNSEFLDGYSVKDNTIDQILSMAKDAWSNGDTDSATVLSEFRDHVTGVPFTFLLHGSSDTLKDNQKVLQRFKSILNTGISKRSLILYNNSTKRAKLTKDETKCDTVLSDSYRPILGDHFNKIYDAISFFKHNSNGTIEKRTEPITIGLDEEVEDLYANYRNDLIEREETETDPIIKIETLDRHWRAFRLATCIAVFEHPDDLVVRGDDYLFAIYLVDRWGSQLKRFLEGNDAETKADRLYLFLRDNPGCKKTQALRRSGCRDNREFSSNLEMVEERVMEDGKILDKTQGKHNTTTFTIKERPADKEVEDIKISVSIGISNRKEDVKGFVVKNNSFNLLHNVCNGDKSYTSAKFLNGHRKAINWLSGDTLMILDIDNDHDEKMIERNQPLPENYNPKDKIWHLPFNECKEIVKDYNCLLVKTKSSGKSGLTEKGNPKNQFKRDRYRILFPTVPITIELVEDYHRLKESLAKKFGLLPYWDAGASKDPSRFYFGSKGEYWYTDSKLILNWETLDYKEPDTMSFKKQFTQPTERKLPSNYIVLNPNDPVKLKTGQTITMALAKDMAVKGKNIPCTCPGVHKDKNASAFIGITSSDNFQIKCSGCDSNFII